MTDLLPILLVGVPRSGTTWLGRMLCLSKYFNYVPEFINPETGIFKKDRPFEWFQYINEDNYSKFEKYFLKLFNYSYKNQRDINVVNRFKQNVTNFIYRTKKDIFGYPVPLLKDPLADFSAEFMYRKFNVKVIVIIRHPAAVVSSFRRVNWNVDFTPILNQKLLINDHLRPYEKLMHEATQDVIENVSILWLIIMDVLTKFSRKHPDWIVVKHEDLSLNPISEFKNLYELLNVPFTRSIEKKIYQSTHGKFVMPPNNETFSFTRNSKEMVKHWKKIMDKEEITKVKKIVEPISKLYYSEGEW